MASADSVHTPKEVIMEKKLTLERAEGLLHVESRDIVERYRTARVRLHWTKTKCLLAGGTRRTSMSTSVSAKRYFFHCFKASRNLRWSQEGPMSTWALSDSNAGPFNIIEVGSD